MLKDLTCHRCFEHGAEYLLYFKKSYPNNKIGLLQPNLLCKQCADKQSKSNILFESQPILISFNQLAIADVAKVMWLCSNKGKENNEMANTVWRKKLLRIKKYSEGRRQSPVMWCPMPI